MKTRTTVSAVALAFACLLAGCATYRPAPLAQRADLIPSVAVATTALGKTGPSRQEIDPAAPLSEDAVAAIAVLNNPELKAQRLKVGVAEAQVFAAGLLPDPQVSVGLSRSAEHAGYDLGVAQELQSILTRGARQAAARSQARQVHLDLLWQECQVAEKARELFASLAAEPRLHALLTANRRVLAQLAQRDEAAMRQNAATVTTVAADLAALAAADAQLRDLALQSNDADHALHALLGLQPPVPLRLAAIAPAPVPPPPQLDELIATLPKRRADLLALQAGYASQEEAVRAAILGQFPAISVGVDRARSAEEGVATAGLKLSVTLPLFDRNRGRIAVARATREQLRAEYQSRLDQAANDADRLWKSIRLLEAQRRQLDAHVAASRQSAAAADREFKAGNLTLDQYANLRPNLYEQEIAAVRTRVALAQAEAAFALVTAEEVESR